MSDHHQTHPPKKANMPTVECCMFPATRFQTRHTCGICGFLEWQSSTTEAIRFGGYNNSYLMFPLRKLDLVDYQPLDPFPNGSQWRLSQLKKKGLRKADDALSPWHLQTSRDIGLWVDRTTPETMESYSQPHFPRVLSDHSRHIFIMRKIYPYIKWPMAGLRQL